jgi:hypothetical protein
MKRFYIDINYATSVTIHREWRMFDGKDQLTDEEMIQALKGEGCGSSTHTIDHPEFTKLREQLGAEGYISIERGWWNGDRVLVPFILNDARFKPGDKFPCAAAIHYDLTHPELDE